VASKAKAKSPEPAVFVNAPEEATPAVAWALHLLNCWICRQVPNAKFQSYCSLGTTIYERSQLAA
jgi:hypothetical protein